MRIQILKGAALLKKLAQLNRAVEYLEGHKQLYLFQIEELTRRKDKEIEIMRYNMETEIHKITESKMKREKAIRDSASSPFGPKILPIKNQFMNNFEIQRTSLLHWAHKSENQTLSIVSRSECLAKECEHQISTLLDPSLKIASDERDQIRQLKIEHQKSLLAHDSESLRKQKSFEEGSEAKMETLRENYQSTIKNLYRYFPINPSRAQFFQASKRTLKNSAAALATAKKDVSSRLSFFRGSIQSTKSRILTEAKEFSDLIESERSSAITLEKLKCDLVEQKKKHAFDEESLGCLRWSEVEKKEMRIRKGFDEIQRIISNIAKLRIRPSVILKEIEGKEIASQEKIFNSEITNESARIDALKRLSENQQQLNSLIRQCAEGEAATNSKSLDDIGKAKSEYSSRIKAENKTLSEFSLDCDRKLIRMSELMQRELHLAKEYISIISEDFGESDNISENLPIDVGKTIDISRAELNRKWRSLYDDEVRRHENELQLLSHNQIIDGSGENRVRAEAIKSLTDEIERLSGLLSDLSIFGEAQKEFIEGVEKARCASYEETESAKKLLEFEKASTKKRISEEEVKEKAEAGEIEKARKSLCRRLPLEIDIVQKRYDETKKKMNLEFNGKVAKLRDEIDIEKSVKLDFNDNSSKLSSEIEKIRIDGEEELRKLGEIAAKKAAELNGKLEARRAAILSRRKPESTSTIVARLEKMLRERTQILTTMGQSLIQYREVYQKREGDINNRFGIERAVAVPRARTRQNSHRDVAKLADRLPTLLGSAGK